MGEGLSGIMRCLFRRVRTGDSGPKMPPDNGANGHNNEKRPPHHHGAYMPSTKLNGGLNYGGAQPPSHHQQHQHHSPTVPISICIMILICYVTLGAVLFHKIQHWGVLESLYFCFTSLGTIGFGDLAPQGNIALYAASAYILIGMAVVAMCFSLIQTELILWLRKFGVAEHQLPSPSEDVSLVSVAVTPKS